MPKDKEIDWLPVIKKEELTMVTVKEAMNEIEKTKYEFFRGRMLSASTYPAIFYFGWRAKRVLKQSKRRAMADINGLK
ncbi:hypothetical protein M4S82_15755 [Planococcus sp. MERTA32b]|nr:hypothetical protein [Planococcus sp. MER TA 32b]